MSLIHVTDVTIRQLGSHIEFESTIRKLPIYSNSELMRFLDFPNETRTMADSENIVMEMESLLTMESAQTSHSHIQ